MYHPQLMSWKGNSADITNEQTFAGNIEMLVWSSCFSHNYRNVNLTREKKIHLHVKKQEVGKKYRIKKNMKKCIRENTNSQWFHLRTQCCNVKWMKTI